MPNCTPPVEYAVSVDGWNVLVSKPDASKQAAIGMTESESAIRCTTYSGNSTTSGRPSWLDCAYLSIVWE
jgi:hypothetical protein